MKHLLHNSFTFRTFQKNLKQNAMTDLNQIIENELNELVEIICNNPTIKLQAKRNSFEDFQTSPQLRQLVNEFGIAKFEKYTLNNTCQTKEGKELANQLGLAFLNTFTK